MWPFTKTWVPIVGIDISSTVVKLLELSRSGGYYRVESFAVVPLQANSVVERNIANVDAVGAAIKKAVQNSGTRSKFAAVALSGSAAITKIIQLPAKLSDDEMEKQILLEADQYIPFPVEEVYMDFQRLNLSPKNPDKVDVLLVASRVENVDSRVEALKLGGLTAKIVDIEAYAMENAFQLITDQIPNYGEHQTVALVDVGATMTSFNVLNNNQIIFNREQVFGGKQLTEEIQRHYNLSYEDAGMAKRQGGSGLPESYAREVLQPFKESMAEQIKRSLQFFYSSTTFETINTIILSGGTAAIPDVAELVKEKSGVDTIIANPFSNMALSPRVNTQALTNDASSLMIACGLTLRSFD